MPRFSEKGKRRIAPNKWEKRKKDHGPHTILLLERKKKQGEGRG